ncbi:unnamed protein product [Spirodela intermedia]|uniref:U-box domain-containing protein n=1 Tax=Spirodela intermedia TaxID=51605 RepID=A0A7I8JVI4_SPIIN|nr:unnamed protein product [Spirodela intermedia]
MPELRHYPPSWRLESRAQVVDLESAVRDGVLGGGAATGGGGVGLPAGEKLDLREMIEEATAAAEDDIPAVFICPISLEPMVDPVTLCTGQTYERSNILRWFSLGHHTCPTTMQELWDDAVTPNRTLRQLMHAWFSQRRHHRKKRSEDVHGRAADLLETLRRAKGRARVQFLKELHGLVSGHGGGAAQKAVADSGGIGFISSLLGPFTSHAVGSLAIAVLARLPLDYASRKNLLQPAKISLLADVLNEGSPETKLCCTRLLETLLQMDKQEEEEEEVVSSFSLLVGLLKMVKDKRSSPEGTSSGLRLLRFICYSHHQVRPVVVSVGAVPSLVERLPDLNRDCMESAWEILSALAEAPQGLQALRSCSQAVPNAVRVLMRVSEACTRHALSVLSAVCKSSPEECGSQAVEAGLAAKLLLVIQSDCSAPLKQRAAELLKLCSLNYTAALFISKCKLTRTIQ